MTLVLSLGSIFLASALTWAGLAAYFQLAYGTLGRVPFVALHYVASIVLTLVFFGILMRVAPPELNAFWLMVAGMVSLFIIELVVFNTAYEGDLWFLNFTDWMVPAFLIATTIYAVAKYV